MKKTTCAITGPTLLATTLLAMTSFTMPSAVAQSIRADYSGPVHYQPSDPWVRSKLFQAHTGHKGFFYNCDHQEDRRFSPYVHWKQQPCRWSPSKPLRYDIHQQLGEVKRRIAWGSGECCHPKDRLPPNPHHATPYVPTEPASPPGTSADSPQSGYAPQGPAPSDRPRNDAQPPSPDQSNGAYFQPYRPQPRRHHAPIQPPRGHSGQIGQSGPIYREGGVLRLYNVPRHEKKPATGLVDVVAQLWNSPPREASTTEAYPYPRQAQPAHSAHPAQKPSLVSGRRREAEYLVEDPRWQ